MVQNMARLLNADQLAKYLGVSREYLRQWRMEKDFPKPVRGKLWDYKAVDAYIDKLGGLNN
jgi:predicted DNA-binding transcriptional regulator AlpA